jgi:hypothetical protein
MEPERGMVKLGAPCTDKAGSDCDLARQRPFRPSSRLYSATLAARAQQDLPVCWGDMAMSGLDDDRAATKTSCRRGDGSLQWF